MALLHLSQLGLQAAGLDALAVLQLSAAQLSMHKQQLKPKAPQPAVAPASATRGTGAIAAAAPARAEGETAQCQLPGLLRCRRASQGFKRGYHINKDRYVVHPISEVRARCNHASLPCPVLS